MKRYVSILLGIVLTLLVSASIRAAEVTYYHTDAMGTPLAISDAQGKVVWKGGYLPFGEEHDIVSNPEKNKRRFVGKEKDEESGLHYFGARYMDEKSGRFISPDPVYAVDPATSKTNTALLANPLRLNRYVYGLNNPYRYVDPDGNMAETVWDAANVAMGAASLAGNISAGNVGGAVVDAVGLAVDVAATATPIMPGGASTAIKAARAASKSTVNVPSKARTADQTLKLGERWVGKGYKEMGNKGSGVFRSADGTKQFRMTNSDITGAHGKIGPHTNFERIDNATGEVIKNYHVPLLDRELLSNLVYGPSGGHPHRLIRHLDSVSKLNAGNDLGQPAKTFDLFPFFLSALQEFEDHRQGGIPGTAVA